MGLLGCEGHVLAACTHAARLTLDLDDQLNIILPLSALATGCKALGLRKQVFLQQQDERQGEAREDQRRAQAEWQ